MNQAQTAGVIDESPVNVLLFWFFFKRLESSTGSGLTAYPPDSFEVVFLSGWREQTMARTGK
jgi:hypothetical protein